MFTSVFLSFVFARTSNKRVLYEFILLSHSFMRLCSNTTTTFCEYMRTWKQDSCRNCSEENNEIVLFEFISFFQQFQPAKEKNQLKILTTDGVISVCSARVFIPPACQQIVSDVLFQVR